MTVVLASRLDENSEVVLPWRQECHPSRGPRGTCWCPCGKARTLPFTAAASTTEPRQSWRSHFPHSRRLRVSGGLSTNTPSQLNSILCGRPSLWPLLVTKGGRSSYSRILAVSRWTGLLNVTGG